MDYSAERLVHYASDIAFCRAKPELCFGPTDSDRFVSTMLQESLCMALQGVIDGRTTKIHIVKRRDGVVVLTDDGPTLDPTGLHAGQPMVEQLLTVCSVCQDARRINRSNYNFGIAAVNALSKLFVIETTFDGSLWRQEFQRGVAASRIRRVTDAQSPVRRIAFEPDDAIIQNTHLSYQRFQAWFNLECNMIRGCSIDFHEEGNGQTFDLMKRA